MTMELDTRAVSGNRRILAQFESEGGEVTGAPLDLPLDISKDKLQSLCNMILENEESVPYLFFIEGEEIKNSLDKTMHEKKREISSEALVKIIYAPQALFKVRPVTRCTGSIPGHAEAVLASQFSPNGQYLVSGSGDTTVRFWDLNTQTPHSTCKGHKNWVLAVTWSPDGGKVASGCKSGMICLWDPSTGKQIGKNLTGHKGWITCLSFEPLHKNPACRFLASGSKDATVRIWDTVMGNTILTLSSHTRSVTCIKWGGTGLVYSASQDCTIKVWKADTGALMNTLQCHGHWVNVLALNTDYAIRTGAFDPCKQDQRDHQDRVGDKKSIDTDNLQRLSEERYLAAKGKEPERLASGSDDFTLALWNPMNKKPLQRMTGHQQLVNDVKFSPDMRLLASASFDKSIKLWDGRTGTYLGVLRGHVSSVYQVSWSADSRLLVSGSSDSTLKLWNVKDRKLLIDLPGHADEVYTVDWSPDGSTVVSGGKDRVIRLWRR
ncbi:notchless protein homolog 1-like isoform X2 [Varroa jacobsoni]|uniref:NLE domain-containing protein n=2 Tax=Varroa TaxID=62624 RepID=A0A7M7K4P2_VARDE|nr:notchless protein homolog 1-like [Varroa destructor]XP_022655582.1 notchless protein homolog 1-like [Varroa destructor]XP_022708382.1 notchless protein homolog 1-like isoform X2 [Varroa jacobsoni]